MTSSFRQERDELAWRKFLAAASGTLRIEGDAETPPTIRAVTPCGYFDVPTTPQRVVVLDGRLDLETSVALGLPKPVAIGAKALDTDGNFAQYVPYTTEGIEFLSSNGSETLDAIEALRPDLILGQANAYSDQAKQLAAIAPVIPVDANGADWKSCLISTGRWTGRSDQVTEALAAYQERVNEFRVRHFARLSELAAAVLVAGPDGWNYCDADDRCLALRTLRDLGVCRAVTPLKPAEVVMAVSSSAHSHDTGSVYSASECVERWDQAYSLT